MVLYSACVGYGYNLPGLLFVVHLGLNGHCIGVPFLSVSCNCKTSYTVFVPSLLLKDPYRLPYVTRHLLVRLQAAARHGQLRLDPRCLCALADQSNQSRVVAWCSLTGRYLPVSILSFLHRLSSIVLPRDYATQYLIRLPFASHMTNNTQPLSKCTLIAILSGASE
jgi:hypothetical protein